MKYLIFALIALASPAAAQGQKIQFASCGAGGCSCRVTKLTLAEIIEQTGITAPEGAEDMILVSTTDGRIGWSSMAPADLDLTYGGSCSCPLQLFDDLVPLDGKWTIHAGATDISACPMIAGQGDFGAVTGGTRAVVWGGRFHPETLFSEARGMVRWSQTGPNSWRGVVVDERQAGAHASVIWTARLVSEREIRGQSRFEFDLNLPASVPASVIAAGGKCIAVTPFTARLGVATATE